MSEMDQETLRRVIEKSIAVCSGKGGVGKTITACNLAIYYSLKDLRVGLLDLDPLSDVASLLDLHESEQALRFPEAEGSGNKVAGDIGSGPDGSGGDRRNTTAGLSAVTLKVFRGLDILFPYQKLGAAEALALMEKIYRTHIREIDSRYDLLIFDMPAGIGYENNLAFLPFMNRLVLVTNPEPTAHASAGAYAKEVQRLYPGRTMLLWHNRYAGRLKEGFNSRNVAGNYNRYVDAADRLTPVERSLLEDFAFVPEDPALDLLQGEPDPGIHVLECIRDSLDYTHGGLLERASRRLPISRKAQAVVARYVHRHPRIGQPAEYLQRLGGYLNDVALAVTDQDPGQGSEPQPIAASSGSAASLPVFTPEEKGVLQAFLRRVDGSALRREILRLIDTLTEHIRRVEETRGAAAGLLRGGQEKMMDRELCGFLVTLNRSARGSALMRNQGVLLLFHFSLRKLLQSRTLLRVLRDLVPGRFDSRGRRVRDRRRQIRILVERDPEYRTRYLKVMRMLLAMVTRQLATVAGSFELNELVLRDKASRIDSRAYLTLLSAFLHEILYGGLSVIVGFEYRAAAAAFGDGAERLLAVMRRSP